MLLNLKDLNILIHGKKTYDKIGVDNTIRPMSVFDIFSNKMNPSNGNNM